MNTLYVFEESCGLCGRCDEKQNCLFSNPYGAYDRCNIGRTNHPIWTRSQSCHGFLSYFKRIGRISLRLAYLTDLRWIQCNTFANHARGVGERMDFRDETVLVSSLWTGETCHDQFKNLSRKMRQKK